MSFSRNVFINCPFDSEYIGTKIWEAFNEFMADFYLKRKEEGFTDKDLQMMPIPEFINYIKEWVRRN